MCLSIPIVDHHNITKIDTEDGEFALPNRPAPIHISSRRPFICAAQVSHNNRSWYRNRRSNRKANTALEGRYYEKGDMESFDDWLNPQDRVQSQTYNDWLEGQQNEKTGIVNNTGAVDMKKGTLMIKEGTPEEKMRQTKLRLEEAKTNFQISMEKLSEGLAVVKKAI
jgi:hypothetical protein